MVFFDSFPISSLSSLVFFEIVVELPQQVLVRALSEYEFGFVGSKLVCITLTVTKEIVHLVILHLKTYNEYLSYLMVKTLYLLCVSIPELCSQVFWQTAQFFMHLRLDIILVGLHGGLNHFSL